MSCYQSVTVMMVVLLLAPAAFAEESSIFAPPSRRPLLEGAMCAGLTVPPRDQGLSLGREVLFGAFARPVPHVGLGAWYEYRVFDWEARGPDTFYAPNESAWAHGIGAAIRAYLLARHRFEPYLQLGLGGYRVDTSILGPEPIRIAMRSSAGVDVYAMSWLRVGFAVSVVGPATEATEDTSLVYFPNSPPGSPDALLGTTAGLSLTVGGLQRPRAAPANSK